MDYDDYKYMLVASYRCPKDYLSSKSIPDSDAELYVPDDEEDDFPEDPMNVECEEAPEKGEEVDLETEDEREESGPKTLDEEVGDLTKPVETRTIYLARPLRRKTTSAVLCASKEILLQLRQSGLHVGAVHTDRAREFGSKIFKGWVTESE